MPMPTGWRSETVPGTDSTEHVKSSSNIISDQHVRETRTGTAKVTLALRFSRRRESSNITRGSL